MVTPFEASDSSRIDFKATERIVELLLKTGTDSIIVAGTTGESPTLSHEEESDLFKAVRDLAKSINPKVKIIFGAGSNSTRTAIESSQTAEELGADGLLIVTPYYNKPNQAGLKKHYSMIASNTSLPIILYNVPGRCVVSLKFETIVELAEAHNNIVALKEASTNIDLISKLRTVFDTERFFMYSGDDSLTLPMLAVGANGVISVASHIAGAEIKNMINAYMKGDVLGAQKINKKLFPLFEALFVEPNPTCIKAALGIMGICSPNLREPLLPLSAAQANDLAKIINATVTVKQFS
jgi:4-hydroxy-tetrahydrodipicolinate synthase